MGEAFEQVHLFGSRGEVGTLLSASLGARSDVRFRGWSGETGPASYAAFHGHWKATGEEAKRSLVIIGGGRISSSLVELAKDHLLRVARLVDLWRETVWPERILLIGSAAGRLVEESPYGAVKRSQWMVLKSALPGDVQLRLLELHSLVPDSLPHRGIFAELLGQYEREGRVTVHHLSGARDYVSSRQLATVVSALATTKGPWKGPVTSVIEVGNGFPVRVSDWLQAFRSVFGEESEFREREPATKDREIVAATASLEEALNHAGPKWWEEFRQGVPVLEACVARWRSLKA